MALSEKEAQLLQKIATSVEGLDKRLTAIEKGSGDISAGKNTIEAMQPAHIETAPNSPTMVGAQVGIDMTFLENVNAETRRRIQTDLAKFAQEALGKVIPFVNTVDITLRK